MPGICKKEDYFDSSMAVNVRQLIYNMIFQLLLSTYIIEIVYLLNYYTVFFYNQSDVLRCTVVPNGQAVCLHQLANNAALCIDVPYFIILLCLTA